jgi:hypothetical protein
LGEHRGAMMLFLDDLPMQFGAYHALGTNNIVLNRALVHVAEAATNSEKLVNAFFTACFCMNICMLLGTFQKLKFVHWCTRFQEAALAKTMSRLSWPRKTHGHR